MTLAESFSALHRELEDLDHALRNLLWAVTEALPGEEQTHVLVDQYESATQDMIALVRDGLRAVSPVGYSDLNGQFDLVGARRAVSVCQSLHNRLSNQFYFDLVAFERIDALNNLARERQSWATWVEGVRDALEACPQHLHRVSQALFRCWQDLTEWTSSPTVLAQATSSGPQIVITQKNGEDIEN